jgi:hypothetical protein
MAAEERKTEPPAGTAPAENSEHPEQEHPIQDAHGGSMAPGLVDDTGQPVAPPPQDEAGY